MRTKLNTRWCAAFDLLLHGKHNHALGVCTSFSTILWGHVSANAPRSSMWLRVAESVHPQNHVGYITLDNRHVGIHVPEF
ncbi:hypothetical protein CA54_05030 [Symmachiella macrocystis]|uniref:Uncharacterized protein n=1 Tax=Symmachiella macrocystis TaxID=2527985 RepID=A0A5C6BMG4_9PLAN|nr:hypothetical protein CA54_05030 [Symmachiella macrocystis]